MKMRRVALKIAYIGSAFHGYQRQPNYRTVEGELLHVFKETGIIEDTWKAHYSVAGRTDKGVHSTGNVISFITDKDIYLDQVNGLLPDDIKIIGEARVPYGFKVRFPLNRTYTYVQPINPFMGEVDVDSIRDALGYFVGEHNYRNFSKRNEKNPIREIYDVSLECDNNLLIFKVKGKSFLWNMVRKMVSALMLIGYGKYEPEVIKRLLEPVDLRREIRLRPVASNGLILSSMQYKDIQFKENAWGKAKIYENLENMFILQQQDMYTNCVLRDILK